MQLVVLLPEPLERLVADELLEDLPKYQRGGTLTRKERTCVAVAATTSRVASAHLLKVVLE